MINEEKEKQNPVDCSNETVENAETESYLYEINIVLQIVSEAIEKDSLSEVREKLEAAIQDKCTDGGYMYGKTGVYSYGFAAGLSAIVFVILLFSFLIGLGTLILSEERFLLGMLMAIISAIGLFGSIVIFLYMRNEVSFRKRYETYLNFLRYKQVELVESIGAYSKQDVLLVLQDLNKAVKLKWIPQGHFNPENTLFMLSDRMNDIYRENSTAFDSYIEKKSGRDNQTELQIEEISKLIEANRLRLEGIREKVTGSKDEVISNRVNKIESFALMIIAEMTMNPSRAKTLSSFLRMYLLTSEGLLNNYLSKKNKKFFRRKKSKRIETEKAFEAVDRAFKKILKRFYREQEAYLINHITA